jgi:hypothetical protein
MPEDTPIHTVTATSTFQVTSKLLRRLASNEEDILKETLEGGGRDCSSDLLIYDITKGDWRAPGTLIAWSPNDERTDEIETAFLNAAIVFAKAYVANKDDPEKNAKPVVQEGWLWVDEGVILDWIKGVVVDHGLQAFCNGALTDMAADPAVDGWPFEIDDELLYESFVRHVMKKDD